MTIIHVCDCCGKKLDEDVCPNGKFYTIVIYPYNVKTLDIYAGGSEPVDLCEDCYKLVNDILNKK